MFDAEKGNWIVEAAAKINSRKKRAAFLEWACRQDKDLRLEVERLLEANAASAAAADAEGKRPPESEARRGRGAAYDESPDRVRLRTAAGGDGTHSVLEVLGQTIDVPRVVLRGTEGAFADPVQRPSSPEMPRQHAGSRYQLQGEIARGGMGAVLKGRDIDLGRDLAIKILLDEHKTNPQVIQRFIEEAQIGGQLQHPGIAPIYELGQFADERPFFSMKLVKGQTLSRLLAERTDLAKERGRFLGLLEQVCQTMAYAHSRGVIHRDLKPANIMVGAFGEVQVMDWGLAKVLTSGGVADEKMSHEARKGKSIIQTIRSVGSDYSGGFGSSGSHTQMGSVLGTPSYMPPEQALGEIDVMDERADVFGLGAILCEILTGDPPYVGKDSTEIFRLASRGKLAACFRRLDACGADDDLVSLAKHCLELEPVDRPRHAGIVAKRLAEYLESVELRLQEAEVRRAAEAARADAEAAQAQAERQRALAETERAQAEAARAQAERRRRRASLALAASVVLMIGLGSGGWLYIAQREARRQMADAAAQREHAAEMQRLAEQRDVQRRAAEQARQAALAAQALAERERSTAEQEREAAIAARNVAEAAQERGRQLLYATDMQLAPLLWKDNQATLAQLQRRLDAHNPDRNPQLKGKQDLRGFEWYYYQNLLNGGDAIFGGHATTVAAGSLTSDGDLVTLTHAGQVRRWDLLSRVEDETARRDLWEGDKPRACILSADGRLAAVDSEDRISIYDVFTGREMWHLDSANNHDHRRCVFSPNAQRLIVVDSTIRCFDAVAGEVIARADFTLPPRRGDLAVSEDGRTLAVAGHGTSGSYFSTFRLDENSVERLAQDIACDATVEAVALSPDGRLVAVGHSLSSTLLIYDATNGTQLGGHKFPHVSPISAMGFSSDGERLATASTEGTIKIWGNIDKLVPESDPLVTLKGHAAAVTGLAFSPDRKLLVSSSEDQTARVWDVDNPGIAIEALSRPGSGIAPARFSPDGTLIAVVEGNRVEIWDALTGQRLRQLPSRGGHVPWCLAFSPTDRGLLAVGYGGKGVSHVSLWDIQRSVELASLPGATDLSTLMSSETLGGVGTLAFSPDGQFLVAGFGSWHHFSLSSIATPLNVWNVASRQLIRRLEGHTGTCVSLDFSTDGTLLASGSHDGKAIIWSTDTWTAKHTLTNPDSAKVYRFRDKAAPAPVGAVAFAPDGQTLAMASVERNIHLWDVTTGGRRETLSGHSSAVLSLAFSPDGRTLASGGSDQAIRLWNLATRRELMEIDAGNVQFTRVVSLAFSPDGKRLLAGGGRTAFWSAAPKAWYATDHAVRQLEDVLANEADFQAAIQLTSDNLRLHVALEKLHSDAPHVAAALAATRAHWHASQQRWPEAVAELERLKEISPQPVHGWLRSTGLLRVARALFEQRHPTRASELLVAAAERLDSDGIYRSQLIGFGYDNKTVPVKVTKVLANSSAARAGMRVGTRVLKVNDTELTAENVAQLATLLDIDPGASLQLTVQSADSEEEQQITVTKEFLCSDPNFAEQLRSLRDRVARQLASDPDDFRTLQVRAELQGLEMNHAKQVADYTAAIQALAGKTDAKARSLRTTMFARRGDVHLARKQWQSAVEDYDQAVASGANDERLLTSRALARANLLLEDSDLPEANITDPWTRLAAAYRLQDDQQAVNRVVAEHPQIASAIGDLYASDRDWERAVEVYSLGMAADVEVTSLHLKRARAHEQLENWQAAAEDLQRAAAEKLDGALLLADFAGRLTLQGQLPLAKTLRRRARMILEKRLDASPEDAAARTHLARFLLDEALDISWMLVKPAESKTGQGIPVTAGDLGDVLISQPVDESDMLALRSLPSEATAIRIESGGRSIPGKAGSLEYKEHRVEVIDAPRSPTGGLRGRYVRIDLPGENAQYPRATPDGNVKHLNLVELQVFSGDTNVAQGQAASQSSTYRTCTADLAVDGKTSGNEDGEFAHTNSTQDGNNPWWEVDLSATHDIDRVVVWNRTTWLSRMNHFRVKILDENRKLVFEQVIDEAPNPSREIDCRAICLRDRPATQSKDVPLLIALAPRSGIEPGRHFRITATSGLLPQEKERMLADAQAIASPAAQLGVAYALHGDLSLSANWLSKALRETKWQADRMQILEHLRMVPPALMQLAQQRPDDVEVQLVLARGHTERGQLGLSEDKPADALAELQQADEVFRELLAPAAAWTVLKPVEMSSKNGSRLELQSDGSILVQQAAPKDSFTLAFQTSLQGLRALQMEALADPRLKQGGPGVEGNFVLSYLSLRAGPASQPEATKPIVFRDAWASYQQSTGKLSNSLETGKERILGWSVFPHYNTNHTAVFEMLEDVGDGSPLQLTLQLDHEYTNRLPGRFRISATNDAATVQAARVRLQLEEDELAHLHLALGTAHARQGEEMEAALAFARGLESAATGELKATVIAAAAEHDVLDKLAEERPHDPDVQLAAARDLTRRGQAALAADKPDEALAELNRAGTIFDRFLTDIPNWTTLEPIEMTSSAGSELELHNDGSVRVKGSADNDAYSLVFSSKLQEIKGVRLEALADPRLPGGGPGLGPRGGFVLTGMMLEVSADDQPLKTLSLRDAWADFSQTSFPVRSVMSDVRGPGWSINPRLSQDHTAIFATDEEARTGKAERLILRLGHQYFRKDYLLGRFRVSFTDDLATLRSTAFRLALNDGDLADFYTATGISHARTGRVDEAVAAFTRALQLVKDRQAEEEIVAAAVAEKQAFEKLTGDLKHSPRFQYALARHFAHQGESELAEAARAEARKVFEQQLAAEPENSTLASQLADLLLEPDLAAWTVVKPVELSSAAGSTLTLKPDGSILASGTNPDQDAYTLICRSGPERITAIRLTALLDSSLPNKGPGRHVSGNFHLNEFGVYSNGVRVPLKDIEVSLAQESYDYTRAIDGEVDSNCWSVWPFSGKEHFALISADCTRSAKDELKFQLVFSRSAYNQHSLGRFRLSVSDRPDALAREKQRLSDRQLSDPLQRLAAAYQFIGDQQAFEDLQERRRKVLERQPGSSAR